VGNFFIKLNNEDSVFNTLTYFNLDDSLYNTFLDDYYNETKSTVDYWDMFDIIFFVKSNYNFLGEIKQFYYFKSNITKNVEDYEEVLYNIIIRKEKLKTILLKD